ncbi:THAP domain-containing protein 2 [Mizuhopecten yessoensis]|uniref:THAP domain-containing protein 2 n=1 Tax=Mizuhopecten yessoensis TaxID=6573 RepID=A0A210R1A5_MIZYE|nr:THAP domain-containing protein 2 [Mizuhopecten yessoensis]
MVKTCSVDKCANQFDRSKKISFFRFPKDKRKRKTWIKALNRDGWVPNESSWICSVHFIDGWHGYDPADENYAPTIFKYKVVKQSDINISRETRKLARDESKESQYLKTKQIQLEEVKKKVSLAMHRGYCKPVPEPEAEAEVQEEDDTDVNVLVDTVP